MPTLKQTIFETVQGFRARLSSQEDPGQPDGARIQSKRMLWMLGDAETGSTWLSRIMEEFEDHTVGREPYVGELFGRLYYGSKVTYSEGQHFISPEQSEAVERITAPLPKKLYPYEAQISGGL